MPMVQVLEQCVSHAHGTGPGTVCKAELMRHPGTKNLMTNFDEVTEENMQIHNLCWPKFPDHPYSSRRTRIRKNLFVCQGSVWS